MLKTPKKKETRKYIFRLVLVSVYVCLFMSVTVLMRYVQNLLNADAEINLTEVVTQNQDVITSRLKLEIGELESVGERFMDHLGKENGNDYDVLKEVFLEYSRNGGDEKIFISDLEGNAVMYNQAFINISGRKYFKLASSGVGNISERIISRRDGEEIFVFSVPLRYDDKIIGTIQKYYTPTELYDLCVLSLYSSKGNMYIINKEGYVLISTSHDEYRKDSENYFRMLYSQGNQKEVEQLQRDISAEKAGFMKVMLQEEQTFAAYTSIEDVHGWYLISSVATSAISSNASIVIKMFYFILVMVIVILGVNLWAFLAYKNRQQENLERIAFIDSVTKGNTYNKFVVNLRDILKEPISKALYLLKFDIDNFKYVNNFYGFDAGDKILCDLYRGIEAKLMPGECIARISSDNFIVLLSDIEEERLKDILGTTKNEMGISIYLSAGIYEIKNPGESINLMIDKASAAASVMKSSLHKKVCFYSEEFDQRMIQNEQLKQAVQQALSNDEMIPFYQPKVDISTGKIVGAEALCRWKTAEGRFVPPGEFIPMCENTGLVTDLDFRIFDKVLKRQRAALDRGHDCVPVSVNFSRLHLLDKNFINKVIQKTNEYQVPPSLIELELTESMIYENFEVISNFIKKLHDAGFLVSMDDFGSGYSSLNMLKDISIDVLKIDKGFVDNTVNSKRQRIIFGMIVEMARQLEIKVVVEGVEELSQVELMKEAGCYIAQGYYYSKPIDEISFDEICRVGL